MKILFSPSEGKTQLADYGVIDDNSFIFKDLYNKRLYAVELYNKYIQNADEKSLSSLFGIKDINEIKSFQNNIFSEKTCEAIKRYSGVSYSYLAYNLLNKNSQDYILNNTIIFSNLFGPILAKDKIPYYKLKQGAKIGAFNLEKYYKDNFSASLDTFLENEEIIDLRAGFYEKFYQIKKEYITYKFIKGGKVVSHFSKAYRGILLRVLAENNILSNNLLLNNLPSSLKQVDITCKGYKTEITLDVLENK